MPRSLSAVLVALGIAAACGGDTEPPGPEPAFPEDFLLNWEELRDCRHSHEHELRHIRVFADPLAAPSYRALSPEVPFPVGATLVKLEYDFAGCEEQDLLEYTVMHKREPGFAPDANDWLWQRVSLDRQVIEHGAPMHCVFCHTVHCPPPYGYDLACDEEL